MIFQKKVSDNVAEDHFFINIVPLVEDAFDHLTQPVDASVKDYKTGNEPRHSVS
jgi:hypothetical protein